MDNRDWGDLSPLERSEHWHESLLIALVEVNLALAIILLAYLLS